MLPTQTTTSQKSPISLKGIKGEKKALKSQGAKICLTTTVVILRNSAAAIIVFDVTDHLSFEKSQTWYVISLAWLNFGI